MMPLVTDRSDGVVVATLARSPVNALDPTMIAALEALLDTLADDPRATVLHLRSEGKAFCAGADLAFMHACFGSEETAGMLALVARMQRLFARLEAAPVVVVAEIGGAAIGGGLELALACDLRIAASDARLALSEARLGLLPAAGGTQRLTRLCGPGTAKRLILGAEAIDGAEGARLGVVQWAVPRPELAAAAAALVRRIAALPRQALAAAKQCIAAAAADAQHGFAEEIAATGALYQNPDTRRRVAEFLAISGR